MITAPYNFVPLNEKVFFPSWSDAVSHDTPFEDGESGIINIKITTKSPLFIRNHENESEFCNYNGEYFIPATSLKGMVRNVTEIMSFSKMSFIDDTTYSLRDLKYDKYMEHFKDSVQCGWFYKEGDKYKIEDCGTPYRLRYDEIDRNFGIKFKQNFMKGTFQNASSPYKKAFEKYKLLNNLTKSQNIEDKTFTFAIDTTDRAGRKILRFEKEGSIKGQLVLTGHPSPRNEQGKISGKVYDFVFATKENAKVYEVDKKVFENFKFAYFDGRDTQPKESPDWTYWKKKLQKGEKVPVFFHKNISGVSSFGLSYLYKFPYKKSILEALLKSHQSLEADLASTLFGYTQKIDDKQHSLKGRVYFSHAKTSQKVKPLPTRYVLLGSPKASYYPIYLVQNGGEYKTLMDESSVLAGWKRYPIHKNFTHKDDGKSTQTTAMTPLPQDVVFHAQIKLHNMKKVEIGALLSALTFHDTPNTYHSLGMAKPYSYGKIKLEIDSLNGLKHTREEYLRAFEACMDLEIFDGKIKWHESVQIKNLLTMATEQNDANLRYMELKDFAKEKNDKNYLLRYVNLNGVKPISAKALVTEDDILLYESEITKWKSRKEKKDAEKRLRAEQEQKEQEEKRRHAAYINALEEVRTSEDFSKMEAFIQKYKDIYDTAEIEQRLSQLQEKQKADKFEKVNAQAQKAYDDMMSKKGSKGFDKAKKDFIKKWTKKQNHKDSPFVAELVEKVKSL